MFQFACACIFAPRYQVGAPQDAARLATFDIGTGTRGSRRLVARVHPYWLEKAGKVDEEVGRVGMQL